MMKRVEKIIYVRLCSMKLLKTLASIIAVFALLLCSGCKTQSSASAENP